MTSAAKIFKGVKGSLQFGVRSVLSMQTLCELLDQHNSDKNSVHSYGPVYENLFAPLREKARLVLELGVYTGGSLRAWRDYFSTAQILGLDCDRQYLFAEDRIRTYAGQQGQGAELLPPPLAGDLLLDLVIDDASHLFVDQCFSLAALWPLLAPGGLYCIEDIQYVGDAERFRGLPWAVVYDLRSSKGRYDDVLVVLRKPT